MRGKDGRREKRREEEECPTGELGSSWVKKE